MRSPSSRSSTNSIVRTNSIILPTDQGNNKERLARQLDRDVRHLSEISFSEAIVWFFHVTWPVLVFQIAFAFVNVYLNSQYDWTVHKDILMLRPGYRPYLLSTLQFISAFMTGLSLNDAVVRFKTCMSALLGFKNALEGLRTQLLASTQDPKLETSVQLFLALAVVLLEKDIVFFTEDFKHPIRDPVCPQHRDCILFSPEVLWIFSRKHWQFVFHDFLVHSSLTTDGDVITGLYQEMVACWQKLEEMVMVRAPKTRSFMTRISVQLFFVVVPMFNEDVVTQVMTPLVAAVFVAMIRLADELGDPWDGAMHICPLKSVARYIAMPADTENCTPERVAQAVKWLNRGLCEGCWATDDDPEFPIPREKTTYPNKGVQISFSEMRTIAAILSRKDWLNYNKSDMDEATERGHHMPVYLREDWPNEQSEDSWASPDKQNRNDWTSPNQWSRNGWRSPEQWTTDGWSSPDQWNGWISPDQWNKDGCTEQWNKIGCTSPDQWNEGGCTSADQVNLEENASNSTISVEGDHDVSEIVAF